MAARSPQEAGYYLPDYFTIGGFKQEIQQVLSSQRPRLIQNHTRLSNYPPRTSHSCLIAFE